MPAIPLQKSWRTNEETDRVYLKLFDNSIWRSGDTNLVWSYYWVKATNQVWIDDDITRQTHGGTPSSSSEFVVDVSCYLHKLRAWLSSDHVRGLEQCWIQVYYSFSTGKHCLNWPPNAKFRLNYFGVSHGFAADTVADALEDVDDRRRAWSATTRQRVRSNATHMSWAISVPIAAIHHCRCVPRLLAQHPRFRLWHTKASDRSCRIIVSPY